jgi:hypothetical protein
MVPARQNLRKAVIPRKQRAAKKGKSLLHPPSLSHPKVMDLLAAFYAASACVEVYHWKAALQIAITVGLILKANLLQRFYQPGLSTEWEMEGELIGLPSRFTKTTVAKKRTIRTAIITPKLFEKTGGDDSSNSGSLHGTAGIIGETV